MKTFEYLSKKAGELIGRISNRSTHIYDVVSVNAKMGYEQVRKKKCVWCKNEFPRSNLKLVSGKYLMCHYCLGGLAAPEAMMNADDKYKLHADQIIDAMLAEVSASEDSFPRGFNDFIGMANIKIYDLFPENRKQDP